MTYKFWAIAYANRAAKGCVFGPFATREEAIVAGMPFQTSHRRELLTGYGEYGPHLDIRWHRKNTET